MPGRIRSLGGTRGGARLESARQPTPAIEHRVDVFEADDARSPSAYAARFEADGLSAVALVGGVEVGLSQPIAAAGRPLTVQVSAQRVAPSAAKVDLMWRAGPGGNSRTIRLSDGSRDASGRLRLAPAHLEVPPELDGSIQLKLLTTHVDGRITTSLPLSVPVVPRDTATVAWSAQGTVQRRGELSAGGGIHLTYDLARAESLFDGARPSRVTAHVSTNGQAPVRFELMADGSLVSSLVPLEFDATQVNLRIEAELGGAVRHEPVQPTIEVGPTRDDANPAWKPEVLRKQRFLKLFPNSFVAVGPATERYNCIACSLGIRNEVVWPGAALESFDRLYQDHGFRPLTTLDTTLDPALEKVVLFGKTLSGGALTATHAAKQLADGDWLSKLGDTPLIRHRALESLSSDVYGQPVRVYARPRPAAGLSG